MEADQYIGRVHYHVLGPLRVTDGEGPVEIGGPQQRLVLAILIVARNEMVSLARLMDGLWGEDPPASAKNTLQVYVHRLRRVLGDRIETRGTGYLLHCATGDVDADVFEDLHRQGLGLVESDPQRASELFARGLGLWTGGPFADLDGELALEPEIARLGELRLRVLEDRIEADLAAGAHGLVLGELEALTREYPLRERLRAQHMIALYRLGRHGEALRAYEQTRRHFIDLMGLDPSAELRHLQEQILAQDPALDLRPGSSVATQGHSVRGYELRELVAAGPRGKVYRAFQTAVGRQAAVVVIDGELADRPEFIASFTAETLSVAQLDHPHILGVRDHWREPGAAYVVTQWIGGGTLADKEGTARPLTMRTADQIASALTHAHRRGVVHGRLTAVDIVFDDDGNAYLAGFIGGSEPDLDGGRVAPEVAGGGVATAASDVWSLAFLLEQHLDVEPSQRSALQPVLDRAICDEPALRPRRVEDLMREVRRALGADVTADAGSRPVPAAIRNPFKGLRAFQEADSADFFGRDDLIRSLVEMALSRPLTAVVGPSGSGKSSVVKAGLIPALRRRAGDDGRTVLISEMYPGAYPFEELEAALIRVAVARPAAGFDELARDERGLLRVCKQVLPDDDSELVLVVDQFEELFSLVADERVRSLFLDNLITAVTDRRSRIRVVLSLRADFFDRPLQYPKFAELVDDGLVMVAPLDRDAVGRAIAGPAHEVGVELEPGLITQMAADLGEQPGGLPLLQYALTELFESSDGNVLTIADYRRIGGVTGALGARAEGLFASLGPSGREAMRQCFLRLVTVDENADDVRRRVRRSELAALDVDQDELAEGIRLFGAARLLTFDLDPHSRTPTVEVAHEALLREWRRLRGWVESQREDLILHRALVLEVQEWKAADRDPSYLLRGGRLEQFLDWRDRSDISLTDSERAFIAAGAEAQAEEEEREAMTSARLRRRLVGVSILAVVAMAAGALAVAQWNRAGSEAAQTEEALHRAETRRIAAEAGRLSTSNRRVALLLAVEAHRRDPSPETLGALQQVFVDTRGFLGYVGSDRDYRDVTWLPEGDLLALHDGGVDLIDVTTLEVATAETGGADHVGLSRSGDLIAIASGATVRLYAADLTPTGVSMLHGQEVQALALTPGGDRLATGDHSGRVRIWDTSTGAEVGQPLVAHPERTFAEFGLDASEVSGPRTHQPVTYGIGVTGLLFDDAGEQLISAGMVVVRAWDLRARSQIGDDLVVTRTDPDGVVSATPPLALRRLDGSGVLVATDQSVMEWTPGGDPTLLLSLREASLLGIPSLGTAVDLGADHVAFAQPGSWLTVYPIGGSSPLLTVNSQLGSAESVAVAPDGRTVAHAGNGGVALWSLVGESPIARTAPSGAASEVTVAEDGRLVISSPDDIPSRVFRLIGGRLEEVPLSADQQHDVMFFGRNDTVLALDLDSGAVNAIDPATLDTIQPPLVHGATFAIGVSEQGLVAIGGGPPIDERPLVRVMAVTGQADLVVLDDLVDLAGDGAFLVSAGFDPSGSRLVVTADNGAAVVWDTTTWDPVEPFPLSAGAGQVVVAKYTPEGSLVTISADGTILLRDPVTLQPLGPPLVGNTDAVSGFSHGPFFQPNGRYMIATDDGLGRIWDLQERQLVGQVFPNEQGHSANASADGRWLGTFVGDRVVLWDLDLASWPELACRTAGRNLTVEEWDQFGPADDVYRQTCPQWPAATDSRGADR